MEFELPFAKSKKQKIAQTILKKEHAYMRKDRCTEKPIANAYSKDTGRIGNSRALY